jgi:hypothetical protein
VGDLEDQAARYHHDRHELTINADFRAFHDMTRRWTSTYQHLPGADVAIEALVREWFEQTLIEVVLCARTSRWRPHQVRDLLSPAALTAAVMSRYLVDQQIRKRLAQRLGGRSHGGGA